MDSRGGLVCPLCPREHTCCLRLSLREYLQHIKLFHAHQPNFHISCGIGGCERTFRKGRTFEHHISSYHRGELHPTNDISGCSDSLRLGLSTLFPNFLWLFYSTILIVSTIIPQIFYNYSQCFTNYSHVKTQ